MSARCKVAIPPGRSRVRSSTRTPERGLARKLIDRLRKRPPQHPVLHRLHGFLLLAEVAVRRQGFAGLRFRRLAAAHADQRKAAAQGFGIAVGAGGATVVNMVDKQDRSLDRAETEPGQTDAAAPAVENRGSED